MIFKLTNIFLDLAIPAKFLPQLFASNFTEKITSFPREVVSVRSIYSIYGVKVNLKFE